MVLLSVFRYISNSNAFILFLCVLFFFATALINALALPVVLRLGNSNQQDQSSSLLRRLQSARMIPDARIFGYTITELRDFYSTIGPQGCEAYVRVADFDFYAYMPIYTLLLGSTLVRSMRVFRVNEVYSLLPVLAMTFDMVETYIQRQGCLRELQDYEIQAASKALQCKYALIAVSILWNGIAFLTWGYRGCMAAVNKKDKQS